MQMYRGNEHTPITVNGVNCFENLMTLAINL